MLHGFPGTKIKILSIIYNGSLGIYDTDKAWIWLGAYRGQIQKKEILILLWRIG